MLDSLRGLAIALVVSQHWFGFSVGWTGVDLFFVLSGYLIGGILIDNRESATCFRTFYLKRAFRILPLYWLLLIVALPTWGSRIPLWSYLTFTQNFYVAHLGMVGEVVEPTWSLAVEEQFYLLLPILIRLLPPKFLLRTSVGLVVVAFLCRLPIAEAFHTTAAA